MRSTSSQGFPGLSNAVARREPSLVGLSGEDDTLELRVREPPFGDDLHRQFRAVGRPRVRHGGHGGGLHQRRGVWFGPGDAHRGGRPGRVGSGGLRGLRGRKRLPGAVRSILASGPGGTGGEVVLQFRDGSPDACGGRVAGARLRRGRPAVAPGRGRRLEREPGAGRFGGGLRGQGPARRHMRLHGGEQGRGIRRGGLRVQGDAGVAGLLWKKAVQYRQTGVERRTVAGIGAAVDGHGEHRLRGRV